VYTGFLHWRIKNQFGSSIFVRNGGVVLHGHGAIGLARGGNTISKHAKICDIRERQQGQCGQKRSERNSLYGLAERVAFPGCVRGRHGLDYTHRAATTAFPGSIPVDNSSQKTRGVLLAGASKR
jgi:hypothetical protein